MHFRTCDHLPECRMNYLSCHMFTFGSLNLADIITVVGRLVLLSYLRTGLLYGITLLK